MCFIGDGNNMMNSLIVGGLKVGMEVAVACPEATARRRRFSILQPAMTASR